MINSLTATLEFGHKGWLETLYTFDQSDVQTTTKKRQKDKKTNLPEIKDKNAMTKRQRQKDKDKKTKTKR